AEDRSEHGEDVDRMSEWTLYAIAEQRVEGGADAEGLPTAKRRECQRQANQPEYSPCMQSVVVESEVYRLLCSLNLIGTVERILAKVQYRFSDAVEHEDGSDAGSEEHREPVGVAVLRN